MTEKTEFIAPYIIFSAPSGAGKTTIVKRLLARYPQLAVSISATTRPIRPGEQDGQDYIFMDKESFEQAISRGEFLEYEQVHGNYYGTLKKSVQNLREQGYTVVFDIDVKGALSIKKTFNESMLIFIKPPSTEVLIDRLKGRKSEDEATLKKRLQRLEFEYSFMDRFDHVVINDDIEETISTVEGLIIKKNE